MACKAKRNSYQRN